MINTLTAWSCDGSEPSSERYPQPLTTAMEPTAGFVEVSEIG